MSTEEPLAYILVLHWRGAEHTRACLQSLQALEYTNKRILLIDNGSESNDGIGLAREFPEIELLRLPENKGFSGGSNAGIDYAVKHNADFIWLLNNDTKARPNTLTLLVEAALTDKKAAALAAAVLDLAPYSVLDFTPIGQAEKISPGKGKLDFFRGKSLLRHTDSKSPTRCDWLAASNLLLRAQIFKTSMAFDERYFLYFEDTELCHRLTLAGWHCVLVPESRIEHLGGASTNDSLSHWRAYYHTRNRLLFFSTYAGFPYKIFCLLAIYAHVFRHRFTLPRKGSSGSRQLRAELQGLRDFERSVFGKCLDLDY